MPRTKSDTLQQYNNIRKLSVLVSISKMFMEKKKFAECKRCGYNSAEFKVTKN